MVAPNSGWNANISYLRREIEKGLPTLSLVVKPTKKFKRWAPDDKAKADCLERAAEQVGVELAPETEQMQPQDEKVN